jgi:hypothetical protein
LKSIALAKEGLRRYAFFSIFEFHIPCSMYQKDYILRLIEQLFKFLAAVLKLIKKGEYTEASEMLGNSYYDFLKEDAAFFRNIPEDMLTQKLLHEHNYTNGHLEILAELFNAEAGLELAQNNESGCLEYSRKALLLFEFIDSEMKTYSTERLSKIEAIRKQISELKFSQQIKNPER